MKRFKEIKDLLENVYFINEEAQLVVTFLENIGFSKPEKLVHDELGTLCGDREVMPAVDCVEAAHTGVEPRKPY